MEAKSWITFRRAGKDVFSTVEVIATISRTPIGCFLEVTGNVTAKKHLVPPINYEFFIYSREIATDQFNSDELKRFAENALLWFLSAAARFLVGRNGISFLLKFFDIYLPDDDYDADIQVLERFAYAGEAARALELFLRPMRDVVETDALAITLEAFANPYVQLDSEYCIDDLIARRKEIIENLSREGGASR